MCSADQMWIIDLMGIFLWVSSFDYSRYRSLHHYWSISRQSWNRSAWKLSYIRRRCRGEKTLAVNNSLLLFLNCIQYLFCVLKDIEVMLMLPKAVRKDWICAACGVEICFVRLEMTFSRQRTLMVIAVLQANWMIFHCVLICLNQAGAHYVHIRPTCYCFPTCLWVCTVLECAGNSFVCGVMLRFWFKWLACQAYSPLLTTCDEPGYVY